MVKKERWFSWGWLIFWFIMGGVPAIIYILIKLGDKHESKIEKIGMAKSKIKKSWYKRWWAIVLFIILGFGILVSITGKDAERVYDDFLEQKEMIQETGTCKSLIPNRINVESYWMQNTDGENTTEYWSNRDAFGNELVTDINSWNDGTLMYGENGRISFERGRNTGENTNLIYNMNTIRYKKTPIMDDGTIGEEIDYKIGLILNPEDKTAEGYKVVQYRCCRKTSRYSGCDILKEDFSQF